MKRKPAMTMTTTRTRRLNRITKCCLTPQRRVMTTGRKHPGGPSASRHQMLPGGRATRRRTWQRGHWVTLSLPGT